MGPHPCACLLALLSTLAAFLPANAAEPFWTTPSIAFSAEERWRVSIRGERISDKVPHAPNASGGGFEPAKERPRYLDGALALDWRPLDGWLLRARVGRRSLTSLRDRYTVDGLHFGVARRLPSPHPAIGLELLLDVDVNRADELYKNSWTEVGGSRLSEARLFDASDDSVMLSLAARAPLFYSSSVAVLVGAGRTRARHGRLAGVGTDAEGCRYEFGASAGAGWLELLESCDNLVTFRETYADESGIQRRLGFSPSSDLEYTGSVAQAGIAFEHRAGDVEVSLGYVYRRRDRGAFDRRIREQGGRTVASSHTTSLRAGFAASATLGVNVGLHYRSTAYLDELPLLYNVFTSERFLKNNLAFSIGATLAF